MPGPESHLERFARLVDLAPSVVLVLGGVYAALVIGSILRLTHLHALPPDKAHSLLRRLRTWWVITIVLTGIILLGRPTVVIFLGLVSLLALREYFALVPDHRSRGSVVIWAYLTVPLQYLWIYLGWYHFFVAFIPAAMFLVLTMRVVLLGHPEGFLHQVGTLHWGVMILVYCLSHVAWLLTLPETADSAGGPIGWFLYLVLLTEFNDIAQALWGRPFGRHKIVPSISPGKSWEGLVGAVICTTVLAVLLAPVLTPLGTPPPRLSVDGGGGSPFLSPWSAIAGLLIAVGGFFGDITMSAVKRDCHVKDSSGFLPGQGGLLDRIDSLTFTSPIFFHYVHLLYYA